MGKDIRLANIYIKIYNKHALTLEDLKYLSKYDPECFEKTCKNIVYKIPEAKEILQPEQENALPGKGQTSSNTKKKGTAKPPAKAQAPSESGGKSPKKASKEPVGERQRIEAALSNLKRLERKDLPVGEVRVEEVKELLGNLYMELLFPHNDRDRYFNMEDREEFSVFNKKA